MPSRIAANLIPALGAALVLLGASLASADECRLNSDCGFHQQCVDGRCGHVDVPPCLVDTGCACSTWRDCYVELGVFTEDNVQGGYCAQGTCITPDCDTDLDCLLGEECVSFACLVDVDADRDRDGVPDGSSNLRRDNCPDVSNTDQNDLDGDGQGDRCDNDDDNDGVPDGEDNCPRHRNVRQLDNDSDGIGNACEVSVDDDMDGVPDHIDNCRPGAVYPSPSTSARINPDQRDTDSDGIGDVCDGDDDNDGERDRDDACPVTLAHELGCYMDSDGDGLADLEDPSPSPINPGQR